MIVGPPPRPNVLKIMSRENWVLSSFKENWVLSSIKENLVAQKQIDIKIRYDQLDDKKRSEEMLLTKRLAYRNAFIHVSVTSQYPL